MVLNSAILKMHYAKFTTWIINFQRNKVTRFNPNVVTFMPAELTAEGLSRIIQLSTQTKWYFKSFISSIAVLPNLGDIFGIHFGRLRTESVLSSSFSFHWYRCIQVHCATWVRAPCVEILSKSITSKFGNPRLVIIHLLTYYEFIISFSLDPHFASQSLERDSSSFTVAVHIL